MSIQILYFASLKEALGLASECLELPGDIRTTAQLRDWLIETRGHTALRTARNLRCARNQEMAGMDEPLADGDEIAFFPPVTGG